jgi:hypothetical protein
MQEKRRQRGEVSSFLEQYAPTAMQAGQRALGVEGRGPTITAAQNQQAILNAPIDYSRALADSLRLSGNPAQPQIRETLAAMQPKLQDGFIVGPGGKITGFAPKVDTKAGTVTTGTMLDGQPSFGTAPISGFRSATARNALPERSKGEDFVFNANRLHVRSYEDSCTFGPSEMLSLFGLL